MSVSCNITPSQHIFLGLSVVGWSADGGREQQTSTLTVQLVEDTTACNPKKYYDRRLELKEHTGPDPGFIYPRTGSPCYFRVDDFEFCGLLQRYEEGNAENGNLWTVVLQSPNIILEKTNVILSDFIGSTGVVPNVINAFRAGELLFSDDGVECSGSPIGTLGGADVTEKGMPWIKIKQALMGCTSAILPYGEILNCLAFGRLTFKGNSDFMDDYYSTEGYGLLFDDGTTTDGIGFCSYLLDLSEMPDQWDGIPYNYRFSGTQELMSLLAQVAEDSGSDLFIELVPARLTSDQLYKVIKIRRFRRNIDPAFVSNQPQAQFDDFVATMEAFHGGKKVVTSRSAGRELAINEPTSVLLFGAPKEKLFVFDQTQTKRYWGEHSNGNMIIQTPIDAETLEPAEDGTSFYVEVELGGLALSLSDPSLLSGMTTVKIYEDEILAAKYNYDAWEIWSQSFYPEGSFGEQIKEKMSAAIRLADVSKAFKDLVDGKGAEGFGADLLTGSFKTAEDGRKTFIDTLNSGDLLSDLDKIYNFVLKYANEFYGKKYAIAIPSTCVDFSEESDIIRTSEQPIEAGWLETDEGADGEYIQFGNQAERLSFPALSFFQQDDGRIECVGRVLSPDSYDGSTLNTTDYIYNATTGMLNVKITPDTNRYTFTNVSTFSGPHVIIDLNDPIYEQLQTGDVKFQLRLLQKLLAEAMRIEGEAVVEDDIKDTVKGLADKSNHQILYRFGLYPRSLAPEHLQTAIAFKSNITTYGPWYDYGAPGLTKVEHNSDLAPWSYGSIANMNEVARYKINTSTAQIQSQDSGSISIVGTPRLTLGQELNFPVVRNLDNRVSSTNSLDNISYLYIGDVPSNADFGPVLTSLSVEYGTNGFTTKYDFRTYSPKYGKFAEENIERMKNFGITRTRQNRASNLSLLEKMRSALLLKKAIEKAELPAMKVLMPEKGIEAKSPHTVLVGQTIPKSDTLDTAKTDVGVAKLTELRGEISDDYINKAIMSMDGLLRPVQKGSISSDLPSYANTNPIPLGWTTREIEGPIKDKPILSNKTVDTTILDPLMNETDFKFHTGITHHDVTLFARGKTIEDNNMSDRDQELTAGDGYSADNARFLAMKGPVVISGWGFDIDGKPIPNEVDSPGNFVLSGLTDRFKEHWLEDPKSWPVGALDVRFDRHRGVWTFPGGFRILRVRLKEDLKDKAEGAILTDDGPIRYDAEGARIDEKLIDVYNPFATDSDLNASVNVGDSSQDKLDQLASENDIILVYYNSYRDRYYFMNKIWSGGGGGGGNSIYQFRLDEDWYPGNPVSAILITANGEVDITLYSLNTDHWGNNGDYGHCYYDSIDQKYYCLTVNHPARIIKFKAYQNRDSSKTELDIDETVTSVSQGYDVNADKVYDYETGAKARWPLAKTGAIGYALYDPETQSYNIIECQQQAQWALANINQNEMCTANSVTVNSFQIIPHGEMNQNVVETKAYNLFNHKGVNGDIVYVTYNNNNSSSSDPWIITDVLKKDGNFVTGFSNPATGNTCLQYILKSFGYESCTAGTTSSTFPSYSDAQTTVIVGHEFNSTHLILKTKQIHVLCKPIDGQPITIPITNCAQ